MVNSENNHAFSQIKPQAYDSIDRALVGAPFQQPDELGIMLTCMHI